VAAASSGIVEKPRYRRPGTSTHCDGLENDITAIFL